MMVMMVVMVVVVCKSADVLYRTSNAAYGLRSPTVHTAPSTYWPRYNQFSNVRLLLHTPHIVAYSLAR